MKVLYSAYGSGNCLLFVKGRQEYCYFVFFSWLKSYLPETIVRKTYWKYGRSYKKSQDFMQLDINSKLPCIRSLEESA